MQKHLLFALIFLMIGTISIDCLTCGLTGNPSLDRAACIASCQIQNCATGYCNGNICTCSRCGSGGIIGKRDTANDKSKSSNIN